MAGSIGLFVEFESGPAKGRRGVLSNSHVLALCGKANQGDQIFQPGKPDAKPLVQSLRVATLADFTVLTAAGSQELDAAVGLLDDDALSNSANTIPDGLPGCGHGGSALAGIGEPETLARDTLVCKIGRTTAWTSGRVTGVGIDNLPIYVPQLGRNLRFDNIFQIDWASPEDAFSGPGDSGSVVYDPLSMNALGLIFAGGVVERAGKPVGVSYACNLGQALQIFGVRMLT